MGHKEWSRGWKKGEVKKDTRNGNEVEEMERQKEAHGMETKLKRWKGRIGHRNWSRGLKNEEVKRDTKEENEDEKL